MADETNKDATEEKTEWPITINLKKPIRDKDGEFINSIVFEEPTAGDIMECGVPCITDYDTGLVHIKAPEMSKMMARLSKTPLPFIAKMDTVDWTTCSMRLRRFFLPDLERLLS